MVDKYFYIPGEGGKHFLFEAVVAIMMLIVRRRRMGVKRTKLASSLQELNF